MKTKLLPRLMIAASMVIFGTMAIFVRNIPISSAQLSLCRAAVASALIGLFLILSKQKISLKSLGRDLWLLLISGAAMGINWILLFEAYRFTTVSVATLSYYFAPVIIILACPILFREKLGVTFVEYVTGVRMEMAKNYLLHTRMPIAAIAEKLGYDDAGYFGKVFRKYTGVTPKTFRRGQ